MILLRSRNVVKFQETRSKVSEKFTFQYHNCYSFTQCTIVRVAGDIGECSFNRSLYSKPDVQRCPEKSWLAIVLFAAYMIMSNVLLLNLLVAMFRYVGPWSSLSVVF